MNMTAAQSLRASRPAYRVECVSTYFLRCIRIVSCSVFHLQNTYFFILYGGQHCVCCVLLMTSRLMYHLSSCFSDSPRLHVWFSASSRVSPLHVSTTRQTRMHTYIIRYTTRPHSHQRQTYLHGALKRQFASSTSLCP